MKNIKFNSVNEKFFIILDQQLNIIYSSKGIREVAKTLVNNLELNKYIESNTFGKITTNDYLIYIDKKILKNSIIYLIEVELSNDNRLLLDSEYKDRLTGLYNRNLWEELIHDKQKVLKLNDYKIMLVIDIDNLKDINDCHGHLAGDECIKKVANSIKASIDKNDLGIRYGGDEFIIISNSNTDKKLTKNIEKNLSRNMSNININLSIGSALINNIESLENSFKIADKNMYERKIKKKNKNIEDEIEKVRYKLNSLMKSNYQETYEEVLRISVKLDKLINKHLESKENLNKLDILINKMNLDSSD
ncbi:diguanylate cyclase [Gottschalkia purinilytica]|uniref:Diguanylate cyclase n=1 Tax=Gottschalkia purinilytica TaxID=1503 RepID=A0A0L0WAQ7_GOTPU|nr:diguanylate cyclase [Gottschalkia purinilytica]KNF08599.1 diguanylate cyclase [Gottschalkia purinilytica]